MNVWDTEDKPFFGWRIAAIGLPVGVGESILEDPLPGTCWDLSGEVNRKGGLFMGCFRDRPSWAGPGGGDPKAAREAKLSAIRPNHQVIATGVIT